MLKTPLNVPQQLAQFQSHGILVQDEAAALSILERVSYYRLSGYALEFRTSAHSDCYTSGTTIEQVYDRYRFDEGLRHILRKYLEMAEIFYRTQIANAISLRKCSQPPHDQHYDATNYYRKEHFQDLMVQLRKQLHYYKDSLFIQHHMGKYHAMGAGRSHVSLDALEVLQLPVPLRSGGCRRASAYKRSYPAQSPACLVGAPQ